MKAASTNNPIKHRLVCVINKLIATKVYAAIKMIGKSGYNFIM